MTLDIKDRDALGISQIDVIKPSVKPHYFTAYLEGNEALPQIGIGYIHIFDEVVNDPEINWLDFVRSQFTDVQITDIGARLTVLHQKQKIGWYTTPNNLDSRVRSKLYGSETTAAASAGL